MDNRKLYTGHLYTCVYNKKLYTKTNLLFELLPVVFVVSAFYIIFGVYQPQTIKKEEKRWTRSCVGVCFAAAVKSSQRANKLNQGSGTTLELSPN